MSPAVREPASCRLAALAALAVVAAHPVRAQVDVEINVNVMHTVGGVSTFDRSKFITIHSNHDNGDWRTDNVLPDLMDDFLNGNDVYFGRNTGGLTWYSNNNIDQDPLKAGWPKVSGSTYTYVTQGQYVRNTYNGKTWAHAYESRAASDILCAQWHPFWPDGTPTARGWAPSQTDTVSEPFGSATGYMMGQYFKNFYANAGNAYVGPPEPQYVEVINEPDYELWQWDPPNTTTEIANAEKLWKFHNSVAAQIKAVNGSNVKVGGYCTAFPDHENSAFLEWDREWKAYIDNCGSNLDFYAIHLYDFNEKESTVGGGENTGGYLKVRRRGSNLEATLDMIEQYSAMTLGAPKPFVVSEYGGRARNLESGTWSAFRDWQTIKSLSSMLLSFADRPHLIDKTIPFIMLKEEWHGTTPTTVHPWRLMRRQDEPASFTGGWVYTEMVKFYRLWSDVKGTRVYIQPSDVDIQTDAYVDGDKAYIILNNLDTSAQTLNLNLFEDGGNTLLNVRVKNMYWNGSAVAIDETNHPGGLAQVQLQPEGTAVLEYTFQDSVAIAKTSSETKHYATTYLQSISAGVPRLFAIDGVATSAYGEAVLRLGIGRSKTLSKQPTVLFNGTPLSVNPDFMGHEGDDRSTFFGELDIPVPYHLIQPSNTVSVTFSDTGGHISSVALRAYAFSEAIWAPADNTIQIDYYTLADSTLALGFTNGPADGFFALLFKTNLMDAAWSTNLTGLPIDGTGAGAVTNELATQMGFFRLVASEAPVPSMIPATFDWSEVSTGTEWWNGYGYQETENGITMVSGGRAASWKGGTPVNGFALKAAYGADAAPGTFIMQVGGVARNFTVNSIDIAANNAGGQFTPSVEGYLDGALVWTILPSSGGFVTYSSPTSGNMALPVDQIVWNTGVASDPNTTFGNNIDNLEVSVVP